MRSNRILPCFFSSAKGLSLLELGIVMVFISLALVPVVKMIGGPTSADGNAAQITGTKNKEAILANAMVNKVLAGDYTGFKCRSNGSALPFNPDTDLPKSNQMVNFGRCRSQNGNSTLFYEWDVLNLTASNNSNSLPSQNQYFQATFNVLDTAGNKLITMPINFFHNLGGVVTKKETTGVMLAVDTSGSMNSPRGIELSLNLEPVDGVLGWVSYQIASPFLFDRYHNIPSSSTDTGWNEPNGTPFKFPAGTNKLDLWDNQQLDLVIGKRYSGSSADPISGTPYNEAYPSHHVLDMGNCSSNNIMTWNNSTDLKAFFMPQLRNPGNPYIPYANAICRQKFNEADWSQTINQNLSRMEAARTAALSLLLNLESKDSVAKNIQIGFIDWDHIVHLGTDPYGKKQYVDLESSQTIPGKSENYFKTVREKLAQLNRLPVSSSYDYTKLPIGAGGTNLYEGLDTAKKMLMAKNYDRRIIVLLTDGEPTSGPIRSTAGLRNYALSTFGMNASKEKQITVFTVGLLLDEQWKNDLLNGIATATPDGQHFKADNVAELKPIFDAISYQIQKLALLSTADRYGLSF